jgi:hypothetical protein
LFIREFIHQKNNQYLLTCEEKHGDGIVLLFKIGNSQKSG